MARKADRVARRAGVPQPRMVFVRCDAVHVYDNGLAGIELSAAPLDEEDCKTIDHLFPNTKQQVYDLLEKEILLSAMEGITADFEAGRHARYPTTTGAMPAVEKAMPAVGKVNPRPWEDEDES